MKSYKLVTDCCTGCGACYDICSANALQLLKDSKGFLKAYKTDKCIECGRCTEFCSEKEIVKGKLHREKVPLTFAAWAKDDESHKTGNSGGIFITVARRWIERGGVVAATVYNEHFVPQYICARTEEQLQQQAWSKFVQSSMGTIYEEIKNNLNHQIPVMFVGAPCQVKGLYTYLHGDNENLFTVQFPCIGMPPQECYQQYLEDFSGANLSDISKFFGEILEDGMAGRYMECRLKNGKKIVSSAADDVYVKAWNSFLTVQDVCCNCSDNIAPVCADWTWGNFWYLGKIEKMESLHKCKDGCSMLLIHSDKGLEVFQSIKDLLVVLQRTYKEAATGHAMFQCPSAKHILISRNIKAARRKLFQEQMEYMDFSSLKKKFFSIHHTKNMFFIATCLSDKQKAWIWRVLYYIHMYGRKHE